jgi:hypothetical protein
MCFISAINFSSNGGSRQGFTYVLRASERGLNGQHKGGKQDVRPTGTHQKLRYGLNDILTGFDLPKFEN